MDEGKSGPSDDRRLSFEFTFDGKPIRAYEGDSIASALFRAGVRVFSRSMKFHRPRGLYCGANRCFSCAMRVDGIPGVRTCSTLARDGMVVETEGGLQSANFDLLSVLDHIFRKQFDYQSRFIRPRFLVPFYQRAVRRLATPRKLPDKAVSFHHLERTTTDVLIVGHGLSGSAACGALRGLGISAHVADRHGTEVFPPSTAFGYYEDGRVGVLTETGGMLVKAKAVLLATGRIETGLALPNADLPGVMLPEAVNHLSKRRVKPGSNAFLIGANELRDGVESELESLGCRVVGSCEDPARIARIVGGKRVRSVDVRGDGGKIERWLCDIVVLLGPLVPYVNLAQQAGCRLKPSGEFWVVDTEGAGATSVPTVFSSGSVTGLRSADERVASGKIVAKSISRFLEVV